MPKRLALCFDSGGVTSIQVGSQEWEDLLLLLIYLDMDAANGVTG